MSAEVRTVVFDIGGVLLRWDPRLVYASLIPDPDELDRFLAEVCTPAWNGELDAGRPFDEACADLTARHPGKADLTRAWGRQDEMIAGEVAGSADLVARLRSAGVALYLLTNMPSDVFAARRARWPVLRSFDGAVVSGDEGVLKPASEIFQRLIGRFDLEPATTLFVDDQAVNVEGAEALGFVGHRFVDADGLEDRLVELGLLAPIE